MWTVYHQTIILESLVANSRKGRKEKEYFFSSIRFLVVKTLWVCISIGRGEGNKGESDRSKIIGYLGSELKLNGHFEWAGADRLGQFTELASYVY